jgi:hypothetical protein
MTVFDPYTYVSTTVHGFVREIVGEEAEKIPTRLEMSPERMIEALNNQVRILTAERDGLASVLKDVRDDLIEEKRIVKGLLDAILEHIGASIEYE